MPETGRDSASTRDASLSRLLGGVAPYIELLRRNRALWRLPGETNRDRGWLDAQMILAALLLNLHGLNRVSNLEWLHADQDLLKTVWRLEPALLGRRRKTLEARFPKGRTGILPSVTSMHEWLAQFHDDASVEPSGTGAAYISSRSMAFAPVRQVWRALVAIEADRPELSEVTVDIVSLVIASSGSEARPTGLASAERGYRPVLAACPELGMLLHVELRDGNVPATGGLLRVVTEALLMLPESVTRVTIRSGFAEDRDELVRFCREPERRPDALRHLGIIGYVAEARIGLQERMAVEGVAADHWTDVDDRGFAFADSSNPGTAVLPDAEGARRFIASRQELAGMAVANNEGIFEDGTGQRHYRLRLLETNLPPMPESVAGESLPAASAAGAFVLADGRCSDSRDMKQRLTSRFAGGILPSHRLGANACWLWLAAISLNLDTLLRYRTAGGSRHAQNGQPDLLAVRRPQGGPRRSLSRICQ